MIVINADKMPAMVAPRLNLIKTLLLLPLPRFLPKVFPQICLMTNPCGMPFAAYLQHESTAFFLIIPYACTIRAQNVHVFKCKHSSFPCFGRSVVLLNQGRQSFTECACKVLDMSYEFFQRWEAFGLPHVLDYKIHKLFPLVMQGETDGSCVSKPALGV